MTFSREWPSLLGGGTPESVTSLKLPEQNVSLLKQEMPRELAESMPHARLKL